MFTSSQNQARASQSHQDMAAIHDAAKQRALQLRQEAMDAFFKAIGVAVKAAARRLTTRSLTARLSTTSQPRALEN